MTLEPPLNMKDNKMQYPKNKRLKILAIAEAANPEWASVPLVGWSMVECLRKHCDVHLVTQVRNRGALKRAGCLEGLDFTAIDSEVIMRPLWKIGQFLRGGPGKGWTTSTAINAFGYYYFEHLVWKQFKSRLINKEYDIVHRVTPLSPTVPSTIAKKCRIVSVPFVLGPINGGVPWPKEFDYARRMEKEWLSYVRGAYRLMPGHRETLRSSSAIIVGSKDTLKEIPKKYIHKCFYLPENAVHLNKFPVKSESSLKGQINACFVGRLVPYKGPDMLLEAAMPLMQENKMTLDIIGDGPMMSVLKSMVEKANLGKAVKFHGWVEHHSLHNIMKNSNIFGFPSVREFGGSVVLEAMAMGLVPIVVNYAGPGELVTQDTGYKVPIGSREEIVRSYRQIFCKLLVKPIDIEIYSKNCIERIKKNFSWEVKSEQVKKIYQWVLNQAEEKPRLF